MIQRTLESWKGYKPVALLSLLPNELSRKASLRFSASYDDLDSLEESAFTGKHGTVFGLVSHLGAAVPGTQLLAHEDDVAKGVSGLVDEALETLGLSPKSLRWVLEEAGISTSSPEARPAKVLRVKVTTAKLKVDLEDGRTVTVPIAWYPRLAHGTARERASWRLVDGGRGIHWQYLDEDISVEGLLAGHASNESQSSFQNWLAKRKQVRPRRAVERKVAKSRRATRRTSRRRTSTSSKKTSRGATRR
jgi:hypothetical protein